MPVTNFCVTSLTLSSALLYNMTMSLAFNGQGDGYFDDSRNPFNDSAQAFDTNRGRWMVDGAEPTRFDI